MERLCMLETFSSHRKTLFGVAYRMLGSVSEAEDMVQEVWLRWQRQEGVEIDNPRAWLVSTMTRLCIDQLRSARVKREEYYGVWLPEPLTHRMRTPAMPDDDGTALSGSLSMAFMLMLESLNPTERATFLLREVFDYDYADTAAIVGKSEANCRQIVRRARAQLQAQPRPAAMAAAPSVQAEKLVDEFLAAAESGQVKDLLRLLAADAIVYSDGGGRVRAAGRPITSADHVSRFFIGIWPRLPADTEWSRAIINACPGFLMRSQGEVYGACSFDVRQNLIHDIYIVLNPDKLRHLGSMA